MEVHRYTDEELSVLRSLFDSCDADRSGRIHINQLPGLLSKLGKSSDETVSIMEAASAVADKSEGQLRYEEFANIIESLDNSSEVPFEGPDPKVLEFLRILEEYRIKCEDEGNYLEAGRAHKQLAILRKQEEKRQQKAVKARQISERQDVQLAHNMQFNEFNTAWDRYMEEYDSMAQMYIQQMTERHAIVLLEFQRQLRLELANKPPKWSRELLEKRRKQHINARNKNYAEAQKLKKICDTVEEKERRDMEESQAIVFARREAKFRLHQQAELQALLKRIECRRKEHIKQRNLDSKRLLQRNRNVQTVLESKQTMESQRIFDDIKKTLNNTSTPAVAAAKTSSQGSSYAYGKSSSKGGGGGAASFRRGGPSTDDRQMVTNNNNYDMAESLEEAEEMMARNAENNMRGGNEEDMEDGEFQQKFESYSNKDDITFDPPFMNNSGPNFSAMVFNGVDSKELEEGEED